MPCSAGRAIPSPVCAARRCRSSGSTGRCRLQQPLACSSGRSNGLTHVLRSTSGADRRFNPACGSRHGPPADSGEFGGAIGRVSGTLARAGITLRAPRPGPSNRPQFASGLVQLIRSHRIASARSRATRFRSGLARRCRRQSRERLEVAFSKTFRHPADTYFVGRRKGGALRLPAPGCFLLTPGRDGAILRLPKRKDERE